MEKEIKLKTHWKTETTTIQFGVNFVLNGALENIIATIDKRPVVITDHNVEKFWREKFEALDLKVFSFTDGEVSKTRDTKIMLEDHLLSHNFGRDTVIIALGGGVVSDLVGFLASTYCRGVSLIQIPTSLLAMVDSSVGGKTAVNTPYGKNMIGTFYPAQHVLIDGAFLSTLPSLEQTNGIVEMIKEALISSPALFDALEQNPDKWTFDHIDFQMERIFESIEIKKEIVEKDPEEEKGYRHILNFGHTFGHAIETLTEYQIPHGHAIAVGILVACFVSKELGFLDIATMERITNIFRLYNIPLKLPSRYGIEEWMRILARDKKALKGTPRMVLIESIGAPLSFEGDYCTHVEFPLLEKAIDWMYTQFHD